MTSHLDDRTGIWGTGPGYCKNPRCRQSLTGLGHNRNALTCSDACRQAVFRDNRDANCSSERVVSGRNDESCPGYALGAGPSARAKRGPVSHTQFGPVDSGRVAQSCGETENARWKPCKTRPGLAVVLPREDSLPGESTSGSDTGVFEACARFDTPRETDARKRVGLANSIRAGAS